MRPMPFVLGLAATILFGLLSVFGSDQHPFLCHLAGWSGVLAVVGCGVTSVTSLRRHKAHRQSFMLIWAFFCLFAVAFTGAAVWYHNLMTANDGGIGLIKPGDGQTPAEALEGPAVPASAVFLLLGNSVIVSATMFPALIVSQGTEPMLTLDKNEDGIAISVKVFDKSGKIISEDCKKPAFTKMREIAFGSNRHLTDLLYLMMKQKQC